MNSNLLKNRTIGLMLFLNILAAGVLILAGWLVYRQNLKLAVEQQSLADFSANQAGWRQIADVWSATVAPRQIIENYFVTPQSLPDFIERLESLATASAVAFQLTEVKIEPGPPAILRLNLTVRGALDQILEFWGSLDRFPARILTRQSNLNSLGSDARAGGWTLGLSLELFNFLNHEN